jgi:hypothetical protein
MMAKKTAEIKPTSGAQWRNERREGFPITLPSGKVARLGSVALDVLITSGRIPDVLTPIAAKTLWSEMDADTIGDAVELASGTAELFDLVCKAAFLEPRVVDDPQADDEIGVEDIEFHDKAFVFQVAIQGVSALRKFCERQARGLEPVQPGQDDESATE